MARGVVPVTEITRTGVAEPAETNGDATNNHVIANDGNMWIEVRNSNGASTARTLTIHLTGARDGQAPAPKTYSIAAAATRRIGPFPVSLYGSAMQVDVDNAELKLLALGI